MQGTVDTQEQLATLEKTPIERSSALSKLKRRANRKKPLDIVFSDVDGTVYTINKEEDGTWTKEGDNKESSKLLSERNIPLTLISGRPDWGEKEDKEMKRLGLDPAEIVISGAGTVIYWRDEEGRLVPDEEYSKRMANQQISIHDEESPYEGGYDPDVIRSTLARKLDSFVAHGMTEVRVEENSGTGFVVLDVDAIPFDKLKSLIYEIRNTVKGITVEYSEDLKRVSEDHFSGWVQIVPKSGGKDSASKYVLEKLASKVNPYNSDEKKKPIGHMIGEGSIDIWMLAMGVRREDIYDLRQYGLGNLTPNARSRLEKVIDSFKSTLDSGKSLPSKRAYLDLIDQKGSEGLREVISNLR